MLSRGRIRKERLQLTRDRLVYWVDKGSTMLIREVGGRCHTEKRKYLPAWHQKASRQGDHERAWGLTMIFCHLTREKTCEPLNHALGGICSMPLFTGLLGSYPLLSPE